MSNIVFINGYPASGKTTLLRELKKQQVSSPIVSKDEIKEQLFQLLAVSTKNNGKQLNELAIRLMCQQLDESLRSGTPLILEANFKPIYDQSRFEQLFQKYEANIMQILITAPVEVLIARDAQRWQAGERHEGHQPLNMDTIYETQINVVELFTFKNSISKTVNSIEVADGYKKLATDIIKFISG